MSFLSVAQPSMSQHWLEYEAIDLNQYLAWLHPNFIHNWTPIESALSCHYRLFYVCDNTMTLMIVVIIKVYGYVCLYQKHHLYQAHQRQQLIVKWMEAISSVHGDLGLCFFTVMKTETCTCCNGLFRCCYLCRVDLDRIFLFVPLYVFWDIWSYSLSMLWQRSMIVMVSC